MLRLPVRFVGQLDVRRDPLLIAPEDSKLMAVRRPWRVAASETH
jgi:hypothetical protein